MSATGRNLEGNERRELDFYETEGWVTRSILRAIEVKGSVLDAGCGTGAILREVISVCPRLKAAVGLEIDPDRWRAANEDDLLRGLVLQGDFLKSDPIYLWNDGRVLSGEPFDVVIANPPYAQAEQFVDAARKIGRTVIFLLRLNFLGSQKRAAKFSLYMPDVYVLPKRPSFTGDGRTDATEYAWFVWGDPNRPIDRHRIGHVTILDLPEDTCRTKKPRPNPHPKARARVPRSRDRDRRRRRSLRPAAGSRRARQVRGLHRNRGRERRTMSHATVRRNPRRKTFEANTKKADKRRVSAFLACFSALKKIEPAERRMVARAICVFVGLEVPR